MTVIGIVAVMNMVNFLDGLDGLAAGVCAISGATFAIIELSLGQAGTAILASVGVSGELLLPTSGLVGLVLRVLWLMLIPALLLGTHFFAPNERDQARLLVADARRRVAVFRAGGGEVEAYAEDPLRDI